MSKAKSTAAGSLGGSSSSSASRNDASSPAALAPDGLLHTFLDKIEQLAPAVKAAGDALRSAVVLSDAAAAPEAALEACEKLADSIPNYSAAVVAQLVSGEGCLRLDGGGTEVISTATGAAFAAANGVKFTSGAERTGVSNNTITFTKRCGVQLKGYQVQGGMRLEFVECEGIDVSNCDFTAGQVSFLRCRGIRVAHCTFDNSTSALTSIIFWQRTACVVIEDVTITGQLGSGDAANFKKVDGVKFHSDKDKVPTTLDIIGVRRLTSCRNGSDGLDACVPACRLLSLSDCVFGENGENGSELKQSLGAHTAADGRSSKDIETARECLRALHAMRPGKEFVWSHIAVLRNTYRANQRNHSATNLNQTVQWNMANGGVPLLQQYRCLLLCHNTFDGPSKRSVSIFQSKPWVGDGGFERVFVVCAPGTAVPSGCERPPPFAIVSVL